MRVLLIGQQLHDVQRQQLAYAKTVVLSHLYINVIFLPRQARDKHRENSKTITVFLGKTSIGNTDQFGSVTYVLNARELAGRSFWEPVDGGT